MTEIEKKAYEYARDFCYTNNNESAEDKCIRVYKDGYEQGQNDKHQTVCDGCADYGMLQKENAELKEQIEKMKRPQNCKHSGSDYCMSNGYCVCDKWELAE